MPKSKGRSSSSGINANTRNAIGKFLSGSSTPDEMMVEVELSNHPLNKDETFKDFLRIMNKHLYNRKPIRDIISEAMTAYVTNGEKGLGVVEAKYSGTPVANGIGGFTRSFVDLLRNSSFKEIPLYRGITIEQESNPFVSGSVFNFGGISSFSTSESMANLYAGGRNTNILFNLKGRYRGVDLRTVSPFVAENEIALSGRFRVLNVRVIKRGSDDEVNEVDIEQVGVF